MLLRWRHLLPSHINWIMLIWFLLLGMLAEKYQVVSIQSMLMHVVTQEESWTRSKLLQIIPLPLSMPLASRQVLHRNHNSFVCTITACLTYKVLQSHKPLSLKIIISGSCSNLTLTTTSWKTSYTGSESKLKLQLTVYSYRVQFEVTTLVYQVITSQHQSTFEIW